MANSLLDLLTQKCEDHPDYERYTELFNQLDPASTAADRTCPPRYPINPYLNHSKKLGIFSGFLQSIDTRTYSEMVEDTVAKYQLDELLLLLAKANVDKSVYGLPLAARLLTVKKYAENRSTASLSVYQATVDILIKSPP